MKNLKKTLGKALCGFALILLIVGCADIFKGLPKAFDPMEPEDGQVIIVIGNGLERTVFPQTDQFSKVLLSFERKDGTGTMSPVEVSVGEAVISLSPGVWEITAHAYNNSEQPVVVAWATNTLTRTGNEITGNTYFDLVPAGTGSGFLRYTITPPPEIGLNTARSRIQIEKDGAPLASLNSDGFIAGVRTISGAIAGNLSIEPGRYMVDIVLDDSTNDKTSAYRETTAILPGLVTELVFAPVVGDFLDPDVKAILTGTVGFGRTRNNSSRTIIKPVVDGDGETNRSRGLSVSKGTENMYFTLTKIRTQTITLEDATAEKVSWTESGTVDGSAASGTLAVFTVDTVDLAEFGGERVFSFSLGEAGKTPVVYIVTVIVPHLVEIVIDEPPRLMYIQGTSLDLRGIKVTGTWSDLTTDTILVSETDIKGFDSTQIGNQHLTVSKNGITSSNGFTITVLEGEGSRLFFDHGLTKYWEPSPYQYYTVPQGRTVVLTPVKWLIPDDAVYEWKVDGVVQNGYDTEYFSYTGTASSGMQAVTVTASFDGSELGSATTTVYCVDGAAMREKTASSISAATKLYAVVAPGQFGEYGGTSIFGAGGFGGYTVFKFDHSVEKKGPDREELKIGGNAFGGWSEPGAIWVSQDDNGNGEPDDTWYELKGSHTMVAETIRHYAVTFRNDHTWVDNLGIVGNYPSLQHWPASQSGLTEITLCGTRLDASTVSSGRLWGYADVNDNGRVSLSNTIQSDGSSVDLPFIDFLKVVTAIHDADSLLGERSTEAGLPIDRSLGDPEMLMNGISKDDRYEYTFRNDSGYDLTISFDETEFTLNSGATTVKISPNPSEYIDFYGGNVTMQKSTGLATFSNG